MPKLCLPSVPRPEWLAQVARQMWSRPADRQQNVGWALARVDESLRLAAAGWARDPDLPGRPLPGTARDDSRPACRAVDPGRRRRYCVAPSVAIVGSRDATPASLAVARRLARDLAAAGVIVVSGMARGVDSAAHAGALEGGGRTIAVIGSGLNARLSQAQCQPGGPKSEPPAPSCRSFQPTRLPLPPHFPLRNRIISGLSLATVVVEAGERSGSLITARQALEQGRDVLAVPGGILCGNHRGCHRLIKDGARLVESVDDVLDEIGWCEPRGGSGRK